VIDSDSTAASSDATPRWRRLPKERPQQIIRAALDVFGERGLRGSRLEDIARQAGLSKGTIYLYFPNKEELFREVVRTVVVERIERARDEPPTGTALEQLERLMRSHWSFVRSREYQVISRLVTGELRDFPDLAEFYGREVIAPATELLGGLIRRGIAAGEFRPVDPFLAARTLSSMFITHASWCEYRHLFQHLTDVSDDQVFDQLRDFFIHAISVSPPAPPPSSHREAAS
jgi:AcrR family transcriptional regulator